jgi:hypothetical protein
MALATPLALRAPAARPLAAFFALWALVCLTAFVVPSPFGDNLTRLRGILLPLVLLAAILARFRPRALALAAIAAAVGFNIGPDASAVPKRIEDARTAQEAFWAPALEFVRAHSAPPQRVEVVPTFGHWEAWWVPKGGFALARGWYRQLDVTENPELYRNPLDPAEYRSWLRRMAIRYVLVPDVRLGPHGARDEANLLLSGRSGLVRVFASRDWSIYELRDVPGILTGPAPASLDELTHDRAAGRVDAPGVYRLRLRYTPYFRVRRGDVCLVPRSDGMTEIVARAAGPFELAVEPSLRRGLAAC